MGTPNYMSPEQARESKHVDGQSDQWALAVIVFECLTGVCPFQGENLLELLLTITSGPTPRLRDKRPDLPGSLEAVLLNVQPEVDTWSVRRVLKREEVEAIEESHGGDILLADRQILKAAGIACTPVVEIGPPAETIARVARENGCDAIIMGTRGLGAVSSVVLGSVSSRVLHLSDLPVTLIK